MIPHNRLTWGDKEVHAVADVVRSGQWASGPEVLRLEEALARQTGRSHARACSSGFNALQLALMSLNVERDDEVLIPAYTCVALPNAIRSQGATPIAVDVIQDEWTLDPGAAARACTPRTKAVIAVHTFGQLARINEIQAMTSLPVIEDCSHGIAFPKEAPMGGRGDLAISSFYATKLVGGGEGGVVLFDDSLITSELERYRDYTDQPESDRHHNMKMSDITAALVRTQLDRLDDSIARRRQLAEQYLDGLESASTESGWKLPIDCKERIWYRFALFCRNETDRQEIRSTLRASDIMAENPIDDWRQERDQHSVSNAAYNRILSLPLYPSLEDQDVERICSLISRVGST